MPQFGEKMEANEGLLPDGEYIAIVSGSVFETSSNSGNTYLKLTVDIVADGTGKKFSFPVTVWDILNLKHPKDTVRNIAKKTLGNIVNACGKKEVSASEELHGIPMRVKVVVEDGGSWDDKNKIKRYMPLKPKEETKAAPTPEPVADDFPPAEENESFDVDGIF
jgi:hypothetical protein